MPLATSLDIKKSALVVIDLQKMILEGERSPHSADDVLSRCQTVADEVRDRGGLVVLVHVSFSKDFRDRLQPLTEEKASAGTPPDGYDQIAPSLRPNDPGTLIVPKRQWGAFYGTDLELQLRRRGVETVILGGISTNFGVESTAREAWERGFQVIFMEDATTASTAEAHRFAYSTIFPRLGLITSTAEVLNAFQ